MREPGPSPTLAEAPAASEAAPWSAPARSSVRLEVRGLRKVYPGGVTALDGIDLDLGSGTYGLLGPNGAGKTTLMRTLATLQVPDEGTIHLEETDIVQDRLFMRQRLGYLPQDLGSFGSERCEEVLREVARLKGFSGAALRREVLEKLEMVNLYEHRRRRLSAFSGGMLRRLGIAQALLGAPRVLIVDEPTAGLDPEERDRFHLLLSRVGRSAIVVVSSHIVEDVARLCDRVGVLVDGRIVADGRPESLRERLDGLVWEATIPAEALVDPPLRTTLLSRRPLGSRMEIRVRSEDQPDPRFRPVPPSLEDFYFLARSGGEVGARGDRRGEIR